MSAGHRQRGPQEGHSTMEEGEEMRKEENEERTREFKQDDMEEGTGEGGSGGGMKTGCGHEVDVGTNGVFVEFVGCGWHPNWKHFNRGEIRLCGWRKGRSKKNGRGGRGGGTFGHGCAVSWRELR